MDDFFTDPESPESAPFYSPSQNNVVNFAETSASATASALSRQSTPRRRRMLNRLSRSGNQIRNSISSIDSDMSDLMQTTRAPFKRKASSSSSKPGKTQHNSSKSLPASSVPTDLPIINTADVFGGAGWTGSDELRISTPRVINIPDSSDDDDDNDVEIQAFRVAERNSAFPAYANAPPEGPPRASRMDIFAGVGGDFYKRDVSSQYTSAILVMPDEQPSGSDNSNSEGGSGSVRYLPLASAPAPNGRAGAANGSVLTIAASHRDRIRRSENATAMPKVRWPLREIPVELFDLVTAHLSRDDVKSMRMVNKEFEQKVSRSLFHTSVVPFNTELYDMIDDDKRNLTRVPRLISSNKGKKRATHPVLPLGTDPGGLMWQNAKEDKEGKVYRGHGLRVFQGFGPHIKRFGMTFEVSEKQLTQPPIKKELDHIESYHGTYDWPSSHYARFANLAGLENTADETSRMKAAFSNLDIVQELALCIDNGLGWLNGPDKSLRSRVFERPSPVFGSKYDVADRSAAASSELWNALVLSQQSFAPYSNMKEVILEHRPMSSSTPLELEGINSTVYANSKRWPSIESGKIMPSRSESGPSGLGVIYTTGKSFVSNDIECLGPSIVPSSLRKEQKEWLLETQWAQQAFLESYMLAVIDNVQNFSRVTKLKITKLSSRFLPMLAREVFWEALPCLTDVTLHVSADWRTVEKDNAGLAAIKSQSPSEAVRVFHKDILRDRVSMKESIKKLNIGWFGGGEYAEGMFARNTNVLPAPISQLEHCTANSSIFGLVFKSVEHLTLYNCWISPTTLEGLVKSHSSRALKKLTLDSVSLTAHPRFPPANAQGGGAALQMAQAAMAMQAPFAGNLQPPQHQLQPGQGQIGFAQHIAQLGPAFLQGANPQQLAVLHQQWNQHMAQMQALFNNPNVGQMGQFNANALAIPHAAPLPPGVQPQPLPAGAQAPPPPPPLAAMQPQSLPANAPQPPSNGPGWAYGHREGSWPQLIDLISPGPVFDDYLPPPQPWEEPLPPRPETKLRTIEFISCGYAKLPQHTGFDQTVVEPDLEHIHAMSPWFRARWTHLKPLMLEARDRYIGQIVQFMRSQELDALQFGWGLTRGWADLSKAHEVEFDGLLPGGTGRFSGTIERGMGLVSQLEDEN